MINTFSSRLKLLKGEKNGNTVIEFALTFPILIFLTFAIFDVGRGVFYYTTVNNIAAETVRYASVRGVDSPTSVTQDEVEAFALEKATGMDLDRLTIAVIYDPNSSSGSNVQVTVNYDLRFYLAGFFDGASITLTGASQMEIL